MKIRDCKYTELITGDVFRGLQRTKVFPLIWALDDTHRTDEELEMRWDTLKALLKDEVLDEEIYEDRECTSIWID